jgi:hypothetical protein
MTIKIHEDGIERDATPAEIAEITYREELDAEALAEKERIESEKAEAKAKLLVRLGITADEAQLLLS